MKKQKKSKYTFMGDFGECYISKDKANRLNVDNGITLCAKCHRKVHKLEGK